MQFITYITVFATILNAIAVVLLIFRRFQDMEKHNRENEKRTLEIQQLKLKIKEHESRIVTASDEEIKEYIVKPFTENINETLKELKSLTDNIRNSSIESRNMINNLTCSLITDSQKNKDILKSVKYLMENLSEENRRYYDKNHKNIFNRY